MKAKKIMAIVIALQIPGLMIGIPCLILNGVFFKPYLLMTIIAHVCAIGIFSMGKLIYYVFDIDK